MTDKDIMRRHASERGEGNAKFIIYLLFLALLAWLAIKNVPTYFQIQNLRHDMAELARGAGAQNVELFKVQKQAIAVAQQYDVPSKDVAVTKDGPNLHITVNTVRMIDFIVTKYEWKIAEQYDGKAM